ncbi:MAG: hypothetical protein EOR00_24275 [Mesorhizobium sp.]|uniref:hypothetical protein n=1 Tax=Mesorhizobium sp. TaxID=1871066 RepID=UPI000FE5E93E|nr:hypothetical protein [Mesorhizobium sp.]RWP13959.1 MAG: hypothetical protein EOR00_24275 [Mesorhizobium sp.]
MTSFADDSEESSTLDAAALRHLNVQKVLSLEELARLHTARLARLARNGVEPVLWRRLEQCDGADCPNDACSAACVFGERREVNRLVRQARRLLKRGSKPWFITVTDPNYFKEPSRLSEFSINGLFQGLRRRLREAPKNWATARIIGGLDIAYNRELDGAEYWAPHVHLVASVDATAAEIRRVFKPRRMPPPGLVGDAFRPVNVKPTDNLANALAYALKPTIAAREAILDGRGNVDRQPFRLLEATKLEHDLWLLGMRPRHRSFLSGAMVSRGGVVARNRR